MHSRSLKAAASLVGSIAVSSCGTTYSLPDISDDVSQRAETIFAEEASFSTSLAGARKSPDIAAKQFLNVVDRVVPVAEEFCREETREKPSFNCQVQVVVDDEMPVRNAYQMETDNGEPLIAFTLPMIADARNEDELAFVLGHEFGHHIGKHIKKQEQQATATGIALGVLMAAAQVGAAQSPYYDQAQAQGNLQNVIHAGFALGERAFSQSYELEADMIGAHIATMAGYDAVRGARYFARPEPLESQSGRLSFWGTHPPDEKRVATVISIVEEIEKGEGLKRR